MQLENTFSVSAPVSAVWAALKDPQLVAPCFPGATLTEYAAESFSGDVKIKVGPITMNYRGSGTYVSLDEANYTVIIDARGRDSRGQGTAAATVTGSLSATPDDATEVRMVADVAITGRAAQFGGSVINEVANQIVAQFAERLARTLTSGDSPRHLTGAGRAANDDRDAEALNLLTVVVPTLKRVLPAFVALGSVGLFVALAVRAHRRTSRR